MASLSEQLRWFEDFRSTPQYKRLKERPIAYFCSEYALRKDIHTYAGGLGILAGDLVREADDQRLPMVAIGLYYRKGYLHGAEIAAGESPRTDEDAPPERAGFEPVMDKEGNRLIVRVPIQDHEVAVQAWKLMNGTVDVYMLDANIPTSNAPADCAITDRLYVADKETRLKQEMILGIGGLRLLDALGIHPLLYHLNEGHSAMLTFELIRHQMEERGIDFDTAKQFARRRVVFTNHTLIPAGNEIYSNDLVALLLAKYSSELSVPVTKLVEMGLVQQSSTFSMTMLAMRMSTIINGVSKLHAKKAKEIWSDHPMIPVTNGVHVPTWDAAKEVPEGAGEFWRLHQSRKDELLKYIQNKTGTAWSKDDLLLGWARRIVRYKRPLAAVKDAERFALLARDSSRPVRIVFAGQPHPSDTEGLQLMNELKSLIQDKLSGVAVFLPHYNMEIAQLLTAGCDAWLNTPAVGFEASGTSGMKAALNGVLPITTKDGWVDEAEERIRESGWILDDEKITEDFLDLLEQTIAPMYYARNGKGVPEAWEQRMRAARMMALNGFSATRMLKEYVNLLYS
jgi:glucan phosphorylase